MPQTPRRVSIYSAQHIKLSKSFVTPVTKTCGGERARTADLLLAKQALSQTELHPLIMGLGGVEPPTSPLSGVRSNLLSYRPFNLSTLKQEHQNSIADTAGRSEEPRHSP
jgi:hypothetical protein